VDRCGQAVIPVTPELEREPGHHRHLINARPVEVHVPTLWRDLEAAVLEFDAHAGRWPAVIDAAVYAQYGPAANFSNRRRPAGEFNFRLSFHLRPFRRAN
jgi:hypothetical protein